jgi:hypothetical protein
VSNKSEITKPCYTYNTLFPDLFFFLDFGCSHHIFVLNRLVQLEFSLETFISFFRNTEHGTRNTEIELKTEEILYGMLSAEQRTTE